METEERYEAARKELLDATYLFYEKLAFYAAGIISLSITFVGYALSKSSSVLFSQFLFFQLYQLLIVSWVLLLISLLLSLSVRLWGTAYAARFRHREWLEERKDINIGMLENIGSYPDFKTKEARDVFSERLRDKLERIDDSILESSKRAKILKYFTENAGRVSATFFILGMIGVLSFVMLFFLHSGS